MSLRGSCLCKAVCYEVDQLDMPIGHCHCATCRKAHAAAFASTAGVMRDQFRWTAGEEKLSAYESSPGKLRRFCSVCGTQLMPSDRLNRISSSGWQRSMTTQAQHRLCISGLRMNHSG